MTNEEIDACVLAHLRSWGTLPIDGSLSRYLNLPRHAVEASIARLREAGRVKVVAHVVAEREG